MIIDNVNGGGCDGGEAAEAAWELEGDSTCGGDLVTLYRGLVHAPPMPKQSTIQVGGLTGLQDMQTQSAEKQAVLVSVSCVQGLCTDLALLLDTAQS